MQAVPIEFCQRQEMSQCVQFQGHAAHQQAEQSPKSFARSLVQAASLPQRRNHETKVSSWTSGGQASPLASMAHSDTNSHRGIHRTPAADRCEFELRLVGAERRLQALNSQQHDHDVRENERWQAPMLGQLQHLRAALGQSRQHRATLEGRCVQLEESLRQEQAEGRTETIAYQHGLKQSLDDFAFMVEGRVADVGNNEAAKLADADTMMRRLAVQLSTGSACLSPSQLGAKGVKSSCHPVLGQQMPPGAAMRDKDIEGVINLHGGSCSGVLPAALRARGADADTPTMTAAAVVTSGPGSSPPEHIMESFAALLDENVRLQRKRSELMAQRRSPAPNSSLPSLSGTASPIQ